MSDYYAANNPSSNGKSLPLFDSPLPITKPTSAAAARSGRRRKASAASRVLSYLERRGERGAIDEGIRYSLDLGESTARPRRTELTARGLVLDSGRWRRSTKRCLMIVWVMREFADVTARRY